MITGSLIIASMMLISARTTLSVPASEEKSFVHKSSGTDLFAIKKTSILEGNDLSKIYSTNKNRPGNLLRLPAVPPAADAAIGNIIDPNGAPVCGATISPKNTLQNPGSEVLNSVEIGMVLDGKAMGNITTLSNLSLAAGAMSGLIKSLAQFYTGRWHARIESIYPKA